MYHPSPCIIEEGIVSRLERTAFGHGKRLDPRRSVLALDVDGRADSACAPVDGRADSACAPAAKRADARRLSRTRKTVGRIARLLHGQALPTLAFVCAVATLALVDDFSRVPESIDWRVIALLFCLMAAVAGLQKSGLMGHIARNLVRGNHRRRTVCLVLVLLPFFASMLMTNDVALITFAPFAVAVLLAAGWQSQLAYVIVLQAVAANLGGMVTPVGNPQNLFIFTTYELSPLDFLLALAPFGALALFLLVLACIFCGNEFSELAIERVEDPVDRRRVVLHGSLLAVGLLAVTRIVPWQGALALVAAMLITFDRSVLRKVDYPLLFTFLCFFVFSGNVAHAPEVQGFLGSLMNDHPMLTSLFSSQVISNVPASVLLAGFTDNWHSLLIGVDLGGLGTPIASLASLIALKAYLRAPGVTIGSFMKVFAAVNIAFLVPMIVLYAVLFVI